MGWFRKGTDYSGTSICIHDQLRASVIAASAICILCGMSNGCSHVWVIALLNKSKWNYPDCSLRLQLLNKSADSPKSPIPRPLLQLFGYWFLPIWENIQKLIWSIDGRNVSAIFPLPGQNSCIISGTYGIVFRYHLKQQMVLLSGRSGGTEQRETQKYQAT